MIIIQSREPEQELEEKVLAILKREQINAEQLSFSSQYRLTFRTLIIDGKKRQVLQDGKKVSLTKTEFNLLLFLACNAGTVLSKNEILCAVWGCHSENTVKVVANTISNLRKKMAAYSDGIPYIHTVRDGYVFSIEQDNT